MYTRIILQEDKRKKIRHCTNNKKYINKKAERLEAKRRERERNEQWWD
jgi:hypothetical protein